MNKYLFTGIVAGIFSAGSLLFGQNEVLRPTKVQSAVYFDISPRLTEMQPVPPVRGKEDEDEKEVMNRMGKREMLRQNMAPVNLPEDPVWQKSNGSDAPLFTAPIQNFDGMPNILGYYPPDTQGDVGTDKYIQVVNVNFAIYSKTGTLLYGPFKMNTIWAGIPSPWNTTNSGDPVVLYDQAADRWLITQFSLPSSTQYAELVAVSQTSDPTGPWYRYVFQYGSTMPDYPKFGIWPDGYYMSTNQFASGSTWAGAGATAMERDKMLVGDPTAQMIYFDLGVAGDPEGMLPSDWDGVSTPVPGEPNYFTYFNDWSSPTDRFLKIWAFHADWVNPANSTFAQVASLLTASFDADLCTATRERCIPQPGTTIKLEALSDRLMYRLQYRNFGGYRAMVTNHTVDVDGTGHAGIRWYELRNTGAGWSIFQQGTWSPDASNRWIGSVAMNAAGDIALGYSVSDGVSTYPSIRYTGRKPGDPLGTMSVPEQTIIAGSGSQTGTSARWGDYSMMSVDPSDDITFWFTTEYVQTTGSTSWKTRIASFLVSNAPSANSANATAVTPSAATLNGSVNPHGVATSYHFEYGTTSAYGNSTPAFSAGSGSSAVNVSANITGLATGVTHHFRLVATNSDGTSNSSELTFIPGAVALSTVVPSAITTNSANSGGNITSDGGSAITARGVCWGASANPTISGNHTSNGTGSGTYASSMTGLTSNTAYHARAYATNVAGTWYGNDVSFTTLCGTVNLPVDEAFPNPVMPACWSQTDNQGNGMIWQFGTITAYAPSNPALTGNYAYLNSDAYGNGNSQNADLVTPTIDLSGYSSVTLSFNYYFRSYTGSSGSFSYSINNGSTWVSLLTLSATSANPAVFSQVIAAVAGQSQVKFKWNYTGTWGYYWAFDDLHISGVPAIGLPVTRQLSNITIPSGSVNCFNASQVINVAGSGSMFMVQSGGSATLIAGQKIDMLPGTSVQAGGYFLGHIAPGGPFCPTPSFMQGGAGSTAENVPDQAVPFIGDLFKVYPNPTTGAFTLELAGLGHAETARVEIFSMAGYKLLVAELQGGGSHVLSLVGKPAGIYLVKVVSDRISGTATIVKQ